MKFNFPLDDYFFKNIDEKLEIPNLIKINENLKLNQFDFVLDLVDLGIFYVSEGKTISYFGAQHAEHELQLQMFFNASVLTALLYQRKILNLHASAFEYNDKAILICGDSEAGKSTTSLSFCIHGAKFINDDIAVVNFKEGKAFLKPYSKNLKLWDDVLHTFGIGLKLGKQIFEEDQKFLIEANKLKIELASKELEISHIFIISIGNELCHELLSGVFKFEALRNQIFRNEFLEAMPETEIAFFEQIKDICKQYEVIEIQRPYEINPFEFKKYIENLINNF